MKAGSTIRIGPLLLLALAGFAGSASAQDREFSFWPSLLRTDQDAYHGAVRWKGSVRSPGQVTLASSFPQERWWEADGRGTISASNATSEPLAEGTFDAGLRLLLQKQGICNPDCPPADFDLGYVVLTVRAEGEVGQEAAEVQGGVGAALLYRHLHQHAFWPFVPSVSLELQLARPLRSESLDLAGVDKEGYARFDVELIWSLRLNRSFVPGFLQPLRFDFDLLHFNGYGPDDLVAALQGESRTFAAADIGYELTGLVPVVRQIFLRHTQGERVTDPAGGKSWMLGIVLGNSR